MHAKAWALKERCCRWPRLGQIARRLSVFGVCIAAGTLLSAAPGDHKTWQDYGGGPDNSKYVNLNQITKSNVDQLKVAWEYPTQDANSYLFNPIIVGNVMYVLARGNSLVALNATTGKEIWVHAHLPGIATRGINFWQSKDHEDQRLIFCNDPYLDIPPGPPREGSEDLVRAAIRKDAIFPADDDLAFYVGAIAF